MGDVGSAPGGGFTIRGVTHTFPSRRGAVVALSGVALDIPAGTVFGLLGPNGAGKTTLVRVMLGLLHLQQGEIRFAGEPISRMRSRHVIAYLPQGGLPETLWELTAEELVAIHGRLRGLSRAAARAAAAGLLAEWGLTAHGKRMLALLSGGQRQLVSFCAALIGELPALVLDEPTDALDAETRARLWQHIRVLAARGRSIVLVTHNLAEAERAIDHVGVLIAGRVVTSGPVRVLREAAVQSARIELTPEVSPALVEEISRCATRLEVEPDGRRVFLASLESIPQILSALARAQQRDWWGVTVTKPPLEDIYMRAVRDASGRV